MNNPFFNCDPKEIASARRIMSMTKPTKADREAVKEILRVPYRVDRGPARYNKVLVVKLEAIIAEKMAPERERARRERERRWKSGIRWLKLCYECARGDHSEHWAEPGECECLYCFKLAAAEALDKPETVGSDDYKQARGVAPETGGLSPEEAIKRGR